ncbi:META domain-containing protein [Hydrogenophaga sp.]|uniref:META domain-containing protein n=1 Tax=Hydrogenophaga sp. TaxID=1904254 RepID=UPI003AF448F8
MSRLSWFAAPVLLALTACALPGAPSAVPLVGSEWRLEDLGGRGVINGAQATLTFPEAGRVAGNSSCNRFFGSYTLMQDRIALGQLGGTRMACAPVVDEQEGRYLDALGKAQRLEVRGTTMLMHVQGLEKPLRFVRTKP